MPPAPGLEIFGLSNPGARRKELESLSHEGLFLGDRKLYGTQVLLEGLETSVEFLQNPIFTPQDTPTI